MGLDLHEIFDARRVVLEVVLEDVEGLEAELLLGLLHRNPLAVRAPAQHRAVPRLGLDVFARDLGK